MQIENSWFRLFCSLGNFYIDHHRNWWGDHLAIPYNYDLTSASRQSFYLFTELMPHLPSVIGSSVTFWCLLQMVCWSDKKYSISAFDITDRIKYHIGVLAYMISHLVGFSGLIGSTNGSISGHGPKADCSDGVIYSHKISVLSVIETFTSESEPLSLKPSFKC